MPNPKTRRGDAELARISDHLTYELKMFLKLPEVHVEGPGEIQAIANALLESFIIHFRVLCDFFYPDGPDAEDVLADHFFDSPSDWERPRLSKYLRDSRDRAHKQVAHLSYRRLEVTPDEKPWKLQKIRNEMMPVIREFLKAVPHTRIGAKLEILKDQVLANGGKEV